MSQNAEEPKNTNIVQYELAQKKAMNAYNIDKTNVKEGICGTPLRYNGIIIGALGISGATKENEEKMTLTAVTILEQALKLKNIDDGNIKMSLNKLILYVEKGKMLETAKFYRDIIGLPLQGVLNPGWNEFDTGSGHLCLHHNNVYKDKDISKLRYTNIVIKRSGSYEDIKKLYNSIVSKGCNQVHYEPNISKSNWRERIPFKQKQISSKLATWKDNSRSSFWIQLEIWFK